MDSDITYRVVDVTPELAEKWLLYNTHNRKPTPNVVAKYAGAMARGEWQENGETIKFSRFPLTLLDGQQRLMAVVRSATTVRLGVVDGLDPASQITMDVVRPRRFGCVLEMEQEPYGKELAALVATVYRWQASPGTQTTWLAPTHDQLAAVLANNPTLRESVKVASYVRKYLAIPGAVVGLCHWLFSNIDNEDAEAFFARLRDGQGLVAGDPIYALRRIIITNLARPHLRLSGQMLQALMIKAWNSYRRGDRVDRLVWKMGGARPEAFPVPI